MSTRTYAPHDASITTRYGASPAALNYCRTLVAQRQYPADWQTAIDEALAEGQARRISGLIDALKAQPWKPRTEDVARPDVPAGRYAVPTEEGPLGFYRVDRPTEGRWAGYTFVKVQASDEDHPVRGAAATAVLAKIAADPQAASARYGQEIGVCGVCGKTLTDEESRARGIGPVCAAKF